MEFAPNKSPHTIASLAFFVGLALVMLALWMFFIPDWTTFVLSWRVNLFASVFLSATLTFVIIKARSLDLRLPFSSDETKFVLLPLFLFTLWSLASVAWAPSWKSAIHHTSIWTAYLTFYCIVRYHLERSGGYRRFIYVFVGVLLAYSVPAIAGLVALNVVGGANKLGIGFARYGEQVLALLPLVLIGVIRLKSRGFVLGLIAVVTLWLFMFSTFGRTNYILFALGMTAMGTVVFFVRRFRTYRKNFVVTSAAMVGMTLLMLALPNFSVNEAPATTHRFANQESLSESNDFRKLMISLSVEMIAAHPITGIGADNFGFEVNRYRELYALKNPGDPNLAAAESEIPERAHNEYLQIFSELGIVGAAFFAWFLTGIAVMMFRVLRDLPRRSIHGFAAVVGLGLFLSSSLVTSYSFRLIQNGFVFFFVLAVAAKLTLRHRTTEEKREPVPISGFRIAAATSLAAFLFLAIYSGSRVASVIVTQRANGVQDLNSATEIYETAARIDGENPYPHHSLGLRLLQNGRYSEAASHLSRTIEIGLGTSTTFSYLASAYSLSGDNIAAEETMRRAITYYPRSTFVLSRYSAILKENGKENASQEIFARATEINSRASHTWFTLITQGAKTTTDKAVFDKELLTVMELQPNPAIYAVVTERLLKFPEERRFSLLNVGPREQTSSP